MPVEVKVYETVMVARDTIFKDTLLTSKNIEFKKFNIATSLQKPLYISDQSQEMIATKVYRPGEVIDKRFCKIKPDITRNSNVTVIFKTSNDMSICVDGIAISEGNIGGMVSVENKTYKKVYMGKVIATNKILVEI
jgi:flagella basal body P-ring formation protein FlgA